MDSLILVFAIFAAIIAGAAIGWLLWGNAAFTAKVERDEWRDKATKALADLNLALGEAKHVPTLRAELASVRAEAAAANADRAALAADRDARAEAFEAQLRQLTDAREALSAQFGEVGARLLGEAQRQFLDRADQRFHQAGEKSEAQLKALLSPVEATLKRYEDGLQRVEKERVDSYAGLREAVDQVRVGQSQVRDEAARLVNALRSSPKARGRWGEQSLRNVLEQAGLSPYADYETEVSVDTEDGRLRPDVVIRMPGGRKLIVDAKCSLNAYLDAAEQVDETLRVALLKSHAQALRTHAAQLGQKAYWDRFGEAADYVVMFIPGEHFLSAALEQDESLWEWAFERRVLLATPTNLVAIARTVASVWRQEKLAEEAKAIGALGKEMYDRLAVAAGHLRRVGGGLNSAVDNYNKFVSSFEGRVLVSARRFRELNVETGAKELESVEAVEALAREPMADLLPPPEAEAAE